MTDPLTATYVYGVLRAARRVSPGRMPPGVPFATTPRLYPIARGRWILASSVPLDRYGPEALEPRLRDVAWVSEVAVGHEAVVGHCARMRGVTVVPMSLFTMFSSIERARAELLARRATIDDVIRRIAGCVEWGVRVTRTGRTAPSAGAARAAGSVRQRVGGGTAFLVARKAARDAGREAREETYDAAAEAFAALARLAKDARRRPSPAGGAPLVDASFLVPRGRVQRFRTEARRQARLCAAAGAHMTLTGPWPAFTFAGSRE
jgi:hypothetical protein